MQSEVMYDRACLAKQTVKGKYGTCFAYYDDTLRQKLLDEQMIVSGMKKALENGEFLICFQPKYDLRTEEIVGAEALIRWEHPEKGFLSPGDFIPIFEKNGFITDLDVYIWDQCCQKMRAWIDNGNKATPLSINVSRADIYNPNLCEILIGLIKKYELSPKYLHLEITETAYTENPNQLIAVVSRLKKIGFVIEMDDFGSGYSSLNMLAELPIDILKLDMKFVQSEPQKGQNRSILSFIIGLAKWLNLSVVAEGVETEAQVRLLQNLGCECAQGYFYSKPLPRIEFEELLLNSKLQSPPLRIMTEVKENVVSQRTMMLILDRSSMDYDTFNMCFRNIYEVTQVYNASGAVDFIYTFKEQISVLVINATEISQQEDLAMLHSSCERYNIPFITIHNDMISVPLALSLGASDYIVRPYQVENLRKRIENITYRAQITVFHKESEISAAISAMKKRAEQDVLTGLLNRAEFESRINDFFYQNDEPKSIFIIFDVDNFKKVNDTYGHVTGDKLLCAVAQALSLMFPETDIIGRLGGDEFAVFIPYDLEQSDLEMKLKNLHHITYDLEHLKVFCSAGICTAPEYGLDYEQLYSKADIALLHAKKQGKNQYCIYTEGMEPPSLTALEAKVSYLLDGASDAMFVCDANTNNIEYINDTACRFIGKDKQECLGKKCYQLFWNECKNCDRCLQIDAIGEDFFEEYTYLSDQKTFVHVKAKLSEWDGKLVKIHYLRIITRQDYLKNSRKRL